MCTKIIFVDTRVIGKISFDCYIFNNELGRIGFGIFINNGPQPMISFIKEYGNRISVDFDEQSIQGIADNSTFSLAKRTKIFNEFIAYVREMEERAFRLVFRDAEMVYIADSRKIADYRVLYLKGGAKK